MKSSLIGSEHQSTTELGCAQCAHGHMVHSRVRRSPAARAIGYALLADALVTLMLAAGGSWLAPHHDLSTLLKAETVGWMRARPFLPAALVSEFTERGSIAPETFALVSGPARWDLQDKLDLYQTRAARARFVEALAGFADARMWAASVALLSLGGLLIRRRSAWMCSHCGVTSESRRPQVEPTIAPDGRANEPHQSFG